MLRQTATESEKFPSKICETKISFNTITNYYYTMLLRVSSSSIKLFKKGRTFRQKLPLISKWRRKDRTTRIWSLYWRKVATKRDYAVLTCTQSVVARFSSRIRKTRHLLLLASTPFPLASEGLSSRESRILVTHGRQFSKGFLRVRAMERRRAEDRGQRVERVVACPHHLRHAKISGKLEKMVEHAAVCPII